MVTQKFDINNSRIESLINAQPIFDESLMHTQYLMKNRLIVLNNILFGMHSLVAFKILFEINSLMKAFGLE